jgi:hypothetical protein
MKQSSLNKEQNRHRQEMTNLRSKRLERGVCLVINQFRRCWLKEGEIEAALSAKFGETYYRYVTTLAPYQAPRPFLVYHGQPDSWGGCMQMAEYPWLCHRAQPGHELSNPLHFHRALVELYRKQYNPSIERRIQSSIAMPCLGNRLKDKTSLPYCSGRLNSIRWSRYGYALSPGLFPWF